MLPAFLLARGRPTSAAAHTLMRPTRERFSDVHGLLRRQPEQRITRLLVENQRLWKVLSPSWPNLEFAGGSYAAVRVRGAIAAAAQDDCAVLILGEHGVGKSLAARLIHGASRRAARPFLAIGCDALSGPALEIALFGGRAARSGPGAQSGALHLARDGTVFLDEVGALSRELHSRLTAALRPLRHSRFRADAPRPNVRVIASSSDDLCALIQRHRFSRVLYGRIRGMTIQIPPLRERPEDVPILAAWLLERVRVRTGRDLRLAPAARIALTRYTWPGNVREMEQVIERAVLLCPDSTIEPSHLPEAVRSGAPAGSAVRLSGMRLRDIERLAIEQTLSACQGNRAEAARRLGLSKKGMYLKIKRWTGQHPG